MRAAWNFMVQIVGLLVVLLVDASLLSDIVSNVRCLYALRPAPRFSRVRRSGANRFVPRKHWSNMVAESILEQVKECHMDVVDSLA
jgi:hypothetical protein